MFPSDTPYPGEHVRLTPGTAQRAFVCDVCNGPIRPGQNVVAFSVWTDRSPGSKGTAWTSAYINAPEPAPAAAQRS